MRATDDFHLEKHSGPYESWPRLTRLFRGGQFTGCSIPGFVIEAQYECSAGYLLITSQDCPFEESNDFVLLDRTCNRLAHADLLAPYATFLLNAHWPESDAALLLHYSETLFYRLMIKPRLFGRGYRLRLQQVRDFASDPRATESVRALRERLDAIVRGTSTVD